MKELSKKELSNVAPVSIHCVIPLFVIPQAVVAVFQVRFSSGEEQTPTFHFLFNFQVFFKDKKSKCEREEYKKERKNILWQEVKYYIGDNKKFTIYFN
jgi:hypothetical protein